MMVRTVCSAVQCTVLCSTMRTSQDDCLLCEEVKVEGKEAAVCCKYACSVGDCADIWVSREIVYRFRIRFISS